MNETPEQPVEKLPDYPSHTASDDMAKAARNAVNGMSEDEFEAKFNAGIGRIYGGRGPQQAPIAGH